jgi:homocysteine S-methyltransferase
VGPYGASLADGSEYRGNYGVSMEALKTFHRNRLRVLVETGADLLACETIPCIDEAVAIMELLPEFPVVQAWISFSCKDGSHISSGENFMEAIKVLNSSQQIIAVGINCTAPQYIGSLIKIASANTDKLIVVYPNKGETWDAVNKCWMTDDHGHSDFGVDAKSWYAAGAKIIGGCCRTNPEDIKKLSLLVKMGL